MHAPTPLTPLTPLAPPHSRVQAGSKAACAATRSEGGQSRAHSSRSLQRSASSGGGAPSGPSLKERDKDTALDQLHAAVAELNREIDDKSLIIHEVLGQGAYGEGSFGEPQMRGGWGSVVMCASDLHVCHCCPIPA